MGNKFLVLHLLMINISFAFQTDFTAIGVEGKTIQFLQESEINNQNQDSFFWVFGDGGTSTEPNPFHTYSTKGVYTVCLSVNGAPPLCKEDTFFILENGIFVKYDDTVWPNGDITVVSSPFGPRWQQSASRYDFHRGLDIPGSIGDPVVNIADGIVHSAYEENDPSNTFSSTVVVVEHTADTPIYFHGKFIKTYYSISSHLNSIASGVDPGVIVKKGELIGTIGQTGPTNYDHNHFEIRLGVLCSRESQRNGSCSNSNPFSEPVDPHVNPLLLLNYRLHNINSLDYEVLDGEQPQIQVSSNRSEIDFNTIEVVDGTQRKVINLNTREGIDPMNIDAQVFEDVHIEAGFYTSGGGEPYEILFAFESLEKFDEIVVRDIWNNPVGTSVDNNENISNLNIYPNPTTGKIYPIAFDDAATAFYQLFDSSGAYVSHGKLGDYISMENLADGMYFLKLLIFKENRQSSTRSFKILKK